MKQKRYGAIDALRGFSIILMIAHHGAYDLVDFGLIPLKLVENDVVYVFHIIFASVFIAISGACSSFSSHNVKRGLRILAAAAAVTLATYIFDPESFIMFGILHFLGCASLIYAAVGNLPFIKKIPLWVWAVLYAASFPLLSMTFPVKWLFPLGFKSADFTALDWFPLLPWIFMYFFGAKLGQYISEGRMPRGFYTFSCPPLEWIGRQSLWIYLLHQPVLLGVCWCIARLV